MPPPIPGSGPHGQNPLGTAPIFGLILKFAIPSIISMLVTTLYNITDQIFIGHVVGFLGNAATTVAFPTMFMTNSVSQLFAIGTAANFNICMGAKREEDARRFLHTGLFLLSAAGVVMMLFVILFRSRLVWLCGATENVYPYALAYLSIQSLGIFCNMFAMGSAFLIRADGSPSYAMKCTLSGVLSNVVLDWLFLFPLGMGIEGAALATVIGQIISFVMAVRYFFRFRSFRVMPREIRFRAGYAADIAKLGLANFFNQAIMMVVTIVLNNSLRYYGGASAFGGDIPLAVAGVVTKLNTIMVSVSVGLSHGCQPIWGFNLGAKQYGRVREAYFKALGIGMAVGVVMFALFQLCPRQIISIFGTGSEMYYQFAEQYLRIFMLLVCVNAIQPMSVNYLSGIGNTKLGIGLSVSRQGLILLPLLVLLPRAMGLDGVLLAGPVSDALACALSLAAVLYSFRTLDRIKVRGRG